MPVHLGTELHSLWLPLICCQTLFLHSSFLPGHNFWCDQTPPAPFMISLLKKSLKQWQKSCWKWKMKKYLIAGSKVSKNCFSNVLIGSSPSRQKSSVLINTTTELYEKVLLYLSGKYFSSVNYISSSSIYTVYLLQ